MDGLKITYNESALPAMVHVSLQNKDDLEVKLAIKQAIQSNNEVEIIYLAQDEFSTIVESELNSLYGELTPTQRQVIELFNQANSAKASDIHITIKESSTLIEHRVFGDLYQVSELKRDAGIRLVTAIYTSMCDAAETTLNSNRQQDARVKEEFLKYSNLYAARYSHRPTPDGLFVVMRLIPHEKEVKPLSSLGFLPEQINTLNNILVRPEGIIIISGPTNHGKSTTLRSLCGDILQTYVGKRLITIEDPPEGLIKGAIQSTIVADKKDRVSVKEGWEKAIHGTLRQDPDVIMIGELQDKNSINAAMIASQTGKKVLSTLHSNDAVGILDRMLKEGIEKAWLADSSIFIGLVSQRLVKVTCHHCSVPLENLENLSQRQKLLTQFFDINQVKLINQEGCEHCSHGVIGRTVVAEVINPDEKFMHLWAAEGSISARTHWVKNLKGLTRQEVLIKKINTGEVDPFFADSVIPLDENTWMLQGDNA